MIRRGAYCTALFLYSGCKFQLCIRSSKLLRSKSF